ncbi:MAG TPA: hypothetical protein VMI75_21595 [Polyangiaceae bacterium]|nr:hypothetical protein [Polyangiaceae bacterium]
MSAVDDLLSDLQLAVSSLVDPEGPGLVSGAVAVAKLAVALLEVALAGGASPPANMSAADAAADALEQAKFGGGAG